MLTELPTHDQELVRLAIAKVRRATRGKPLVLFTAVRHEALEAFGEALAGGARSTASVIREFRQPNEAPCNQLSDRLFYRFATHFIGRSTWPRKRRRNCTPNPIWLPSAPPPSANGSNLSPTRLNA